MNDALRDRLLAEPDMEQQVELIKEALVEENQRITNELRSVSVEAANLKTGISEKDQTVAELQKELEARRSEEEGRRQELLQEQAIRQEMAGRLDLMGAAQKFIATSASMMAVLIGAGVGIGFLLDWVAEVDLWKVITGAEGLAILLGIWAIDWLGAKKSVILSTRASMRFRTAKNVLSVVALGVLANAIWHVVRQVWL